MTNPKKKPAPKGVPMPNVYFFQCSWRESDEGELYPHAEAWNWTPDQLSIRLLEEEHKMVCRWLANPQKPKVVRR